MKGLLVLVVGIHRFGGPAGLQARAATREPPANVGRRGSSSKQYEPIEVRTKYGTFFCMR